MKQSVAIIGGGPSALALAAFLNPKKFEVTIYERNKTLGRKFLVAGKGGFNLTHSEDIEAMIARYTDHPIIEQSLRAFTNEDFRNWLNSIGIPTYVGSSKRVYPEKGIKPIEVFNAILAVLDKNGTKIEVEKQWVGWNSENALVFESGEIVAPEYAVFSLGGGSWKVTGSDGSWLETFAQKGIETKAFIAANCAYQVDWNHDFIQKNEGQALKNITLRCSDKVAIGELVITQFGLEGNAIYALSGEIQTQLTEQGTATVYLDMKPTLSEEAVLEKLIRSNAKTTDLLRKNLKLSKSQIDLLKTYLSKEEFLRKDVLVQKIKHFPIPLIDAAPLDEAISTTGGISMDAIGENFELKQLNNSFCMGEMLDWNAPTGGYLLQACFSMGIFLAKHFNQEKE